MLGGKFLHLASMILSIVLCALPAAYSENEVWKGNSEMSSADMCDNNRIRPYTRNPFYWQYKGEPVLLLGASGADNLFQWTGNRLTDHLDLLKAVGGNYVRNTMHARINHSEVGTKFGYQQAFRKVGELYDLDQWNEEYWDRLETLLRETHKREIIVQLEFWDYWAHCNERWDEHPFNPKNNVNYSAAETGVPEVYKHERYPGNPFFLVVPGLNHNEVVLFYQQKYIRKIIQMCLQFDHVLFQINNESSFPHEVGDYWARFLKEEAGEKDVYVTDMRYVRDLTEAQWQYVIDHPDTYDFVDISQNSRNSGETHWNMLQNVRTKLLDNPRPINHTKTYASFCWDENSGGIQDMVERLWRNIFGGAASCRFHRPDRWLTGIGLHPISRQNIRSMRMFTDALDIFVMEPHIELLSACEENEAYCMAEPGRQYAVYFTGIGDRSVEIDLSAATGKLTQRWLHIHECQWREETIIDGGGLHTLTAPRLSRSFSRVPGGMQWAVLIRVQR